MAGLKEEVLMAELNPNHCRLSGCPPERTMPGLSDPWVTAVSYVINAVQLEGNCVRCEKRTPSDPPHRDQLRHYLAVSR